MNSSNNEVNVYIYTDSYLNSLFLRLQSQALTHHPAADAILEFFRAGRGFWCPHRASSDLARVDFESAVAALEQDPFFDEPCYRVAHGREADRIEIGNRLQCQVLRRCSGARPGRQEKRTARSV